MQGGAQDVAPASYGPNNSGGSIIGSQRGDIRDDAQRLTAHIAHSIDDRRRCLNGLDVQPYAGIR